VIRLPPASFPFDYGAFVNALATWFASSQRDLPWRHSENARDAYRVLVSEVMLQQTTVKAVVPFYNRFLTRFPDVQTLAAATIEEVLPFWAGLGYYSRARMLHKCAQEIVQNHGGVFPSELDRVLDLPGIGRYTAGAVTSIAFGAKSPIVDANVARLFSRLFLIDGDLKSGANQKTLWHHATQVVEHCDQNAPPSIVNPAMMELGALVCTPRAPRCEICPVQSFCGAFRTHRQNELPFIAPKRQSVEMRDLCAFATRESSTGSGEVLLRQRAHDEKLWWRGMWELPRVTCRENEDAAQALKRLFQDELQIAPDSVNVQAQLKTVQHGVTHHKITLECWKVELPDDFQTSTAQWFEWDELQHLALPSSMKSLLAWLRKHRENEQKVLF
jgi:A/G-specific adenine glycosylase